MGNLVDIEQTMRVITDMHARYDVSIRFGHGSCWTNGSVISINAGDPEDAIWYRLVEAKITHEAGGHLRHTDFVNASKVLNTASKTFAGINNIIEDCRVETACMLEYSGAYWVFRNMTYDLIEEGYFQIPDEHTPPASLLFAWLLYSGRGIAVDGQEHLKKYGDFCRGQLEQLGLPSELFDQIEARMPSWAHLQSTMAGIDETREVMTLLKQLHQAEPQEPQPPQLDDGDSSGNTGDQQEQSQPENTSGSCDGNNSDDESDDDADGNGNSDADGDSDDDADGNGNSDADGDSDDDADGNGNSDADGDSDDDADGNGNSDAGGDSDDDADGNGNSDAGGDSDDDADGNGNSDADGQSADGDSSEESTSADASNSNGGSGTGEGRVNPLAELDFQSLGDSYEDMHDALGKAIDARAESSPATSDQICAYNPLLEVDHRPCSNLLTQSIHEDSRSIRRIIESQMWAKESQPVHYDDCGCEFDADLLAGIAAGNNRIFFTEDVVETYKSSFVLLIDISGSMCREVTPIKDRLFIAQQAALAIATALEDLDVPVAVIYFNDTAYLGKSFTQQMPEMLNRVGVDPCGGTDTNVAIQAARHEFMKLENVDRKQLLVITDGQPNSVSAVKREVALCKQGGIDVASIHIDENMYGGIDNYKVLLNASELPSVLEEVVREHMLDSINIY